MTGKLECPINFFEYFTGSEVSYNNNPTAWEETLHVPQGYNIVAWSIRNGNSATSIFGVETLTNSKISGFVRNNLNTNTYKASPTIFIHAIRSTYLQIKH